MRRDFRQFGLADSIVRRRGKRSEWLDQLDAARDWPALETIVAGIYASREGGLAYPLLTYVKLLLLQQWYGLSDEGLEAAVDDRPDQGPRTRAAAGLELEGGAAHGRRRCLNAVTAGRRLVRGAKGRAEVS